MATRTTRIKIEIELSEEQAERIRAAWFAAATRRDAPKDLRQRHWLLVARDRAERAARRAIDELGDDFK